MKTLEENRYRKLVNADARRIAWFVNNSLSEDYDTMPESMRKKWVKAEYKKERYMAKKFLESKKQNESVENKIRQVIRETIRDLTEAYRGTSLFFDKKDKSKLEKILKKYKGNYPFNIGGITNYELRDAGSKGIEWGGIPKYKYDKAIEFFMNNKVNPRG